MDKGLEVARLVPPQKRAMTDSMADRKPAADAAWMKHRLEEIEAIFPEPVIGASEELEASRADIV
ncbi:hypothetical protein [Prosthecobacter sp.]|uniref:hypothetical protein n=1 Tax=Prosthecobacter sp. TaxID=1965333 RepID=UPI00378317A0